jgi:hypothetical protein
VQRTTEHEKTRKNARRNVRIRLRVPEKELGASAAVVHDILALKMNRSAVATKETLRRLTNLMTRAKIQIAQRG